MLNEENDQSIDKNLELTLMLELVNKSKCPNIHIIEDLKEARWGKLGQKKIFEKIIGQCLNLMKILKSQI